MFTKTLAAATLLFVAGSANAQSPLRGYSCAQVRDAVVRYGGIQNAEALARSQGGSERELSSAKRCLTKPKHYRRS